MPDHQNVAALISMPMRMMPRLVEAGYTGNPADVWWYRRLLFGTQLGSASTLHSSDVDGAQVSFHECLETSVWQDPRLQVAVHAKAAADEQVLFAPSAIRPSGC